MTKLAGASNAVEGPPGGYSMPTGQLQHNQSAVTIPSCTVNYRACVALAKRGGSQREG